MITHIQWQRVEKMNYKRIFVIVMDSVGCGYTEKSIEYGDINVNTLKHISEYNNGITLPTLEKLGIGNLTNIIGVNKNNNTIGAYGYMDELSIGKDTLTGHWEMMGIKTTTPFKTFTDTGFPKELIDKIEKETGHKIIGNISASGTEIIKELGLEHIKTGKMIVYTSSDSVLQIAAHEKYFGLNELYRVCEITRKICMDPKYMVGRIIARPFIGETPNDFIRTENRHDYAVSPSDITALNILKDNNLDVISVGKIKDIFNNSGITESYKSKNNEDGMRITIDLLKKDFKGLCFVNLVDFDSLYGHRRDPVGYKKALEEFDSLLNEMISKLNKDDLVIITADHGNDPTWIGTDHTREYVPLLAYSPNIKNINLGKRSTFSDIGKTILDNFNLSGLKIGKSFLDEITIKE